ncbi:hypothetical protein ACFX2I_014675 [Malus domestica]
MGRDSETSTNENSNVQGLGPRRSTRLNIAVSEVAPLRGITVAATQGKVHGATTTARAMPLQLSRAQALAEPACAIQSQSEPNALPSQAQALHPCAPHAE